LNPKILTISVCTQYFAQKVPTQYSKEALLFHQTKDPILNSQFPWKPENNRKQNHPAISKQHIGLDTQKIGTRRNKVQKKQVHFENNHWTKKNYRTREGKPNSKKQKKSN
jgi:hypothetical protein